MYTIKIVSDLEEAQYLWKLFSPNEYLYDEWDFRMCFYENQTYPIRFHVAYFNNDPVGLLPLQFDPDRNVLSTFGSMYMDHNRVLYLENHEESAKALLESIDSSISFRDIMGDSDYVKSLSIEDYIYHIDLKEFNSAEDYIRSRLSKKRRNEMLKVFKEYDQRYKVKISKSDSDHKTLNAIKEMNLQTFDDSWFKEEFIFNSFKNVIERFDTEIVNIYDDTNNIVAASFSVIYKDSYVYMMTGAQNKKVNNIGKYLNYLNIQHSFDLDLKKFDAGLGDCNWKLLWHMDRYPQYEYVRIIG